MVAEAPHVVVVGSGMAGLVTALLVEEPLRVLLVTKKGRADSNTNYAQGGLAAAVGPEDCPTIHMVDTLRAGAGLCDPEVVRGVVEEGPRVVRMLQDWGVRFSTREGALDLGREGGHSRRRIVHALDRTGEEIERTLLSRIRAKETVTLVENALATDVITSPGPQGCRVAGVEVLRETPHGEERVVVWTQAVVLATGGAGQVYLFTSNPPIATGDGVAMAFRCGAPVSNLEFVQFHPTTFYNHPSGPFLISEALRGEGARLVLPDGSAFMHKYDPRRELAPRDIVARAIDQEMKLHGLPCVYLDATHLDPDFARQRFPVIYQRCLEAGVDFTRQPIPVVPAAHYFCGGVRTDAVAATRVRGLYACGEVACTGLHGANRLASNSLLEAIVFATRASSQVSALCEAHAALPPPEVVEVLRPRISPEMESLRERIRTTMWEHAGIVRSDRGLAEAVRVLDGLVEPVREVAQQAGRAGVELANVLLVARLIARAAQWRKESRGLHYNVDHPRRGPRQWRRESVIEPGEL